MGSLLTCPNAVALTHEEEVRWNMDGSRVGWVMASAPSGAFWSFALEKLVLESWPWWGHAAAGTGFMLLAYWWMRRSDQKMVPKVLEEEGWLDRDGAEQMIRDSSVFRNRLKDHAYREFATLEDSPYHGHGQRVIAQDKMFDRREREVVTQMRQEYIQQRGHLAKRDLYHEDTLTAWLIDLEPDSEPESPAFDGLSFFQDDDP